MAHDLRILADRFTFGMSMKKLKGKFRISSTSSVTSQISLDEWTKYDDRLLDCVYRHDLQKLKETLKKKGASPVKLSRDGQTAIHVAVKKSLMEFVDCMLGEQPDLSQSDIQGRTVHHLAASNGDTIMLKKLLDYSHLDLDVKDGHDMSALHYAVKSGNLACVKLLLYDKSPVEIRDSENKTPLLLALVEGHEKIAMLLIDHGVNINVKDNKNRTPLIISCVQGMLQVTTLLLSKGAEMNVKDNDGKSLDVIASEAGHSDIADLLRNGAYDSGIADNDTSDSIEVQNSDEEIPSPKTRNGQVFTDGDNLNSDAPQLDRSIKKSSSSASKKKHSSSLGKCDENSFTSSIIESLMGFDVSSDTVSEVSATEDQIHMKMENERKSLEEHILQKDIKIHELEAEMASLKGKLKLETEMRFAAEKEIHDLKTQRDMLMETNDNTHTVNVTFGSSEHLPGDDTMDGGDKPDSDNEGEQLQDVDSPEIDGNRIRDKQDEKDVDSAVSEEEQPLSEEDQPRSDSENHAGSDSDESVSKETGYRKKSLGTAKQHIDMLEEHILSLEEDILHKDDEISELEKQLQSSKELVDLNNNTTVSLELFNELKDEKIAERTSFKNEIRQLERRVDQLEESERVTNTEKTSLQRKLEDEYDNSKELRAQLNDLQEKVELLQNQLVVCNKTCQDTIDCYRNNMISLYQNDMDSKLKEILARIVKLRS